MNRTGFGRKNIAFTLWLAVLATGVAADGRPALAGDLVPAPAPAVASQGAAKGDLVEVNVTATLEDGSLVYTTRKEVAAAPDRPRIEGYRDPEMFVPELVLAGVSSAQPALAEAVLGLAAGEKKVLLLSPDQAFGAVDPNRRKALPRTRVQPRLIRLSAPAFVEQFGRFPAVGNEFELSHYFTSKVIEVGEQEVVLENLPGTDRATIHESFGSVEVRRDGDTLQLTLTPVVGAQFPLQEQAGRIVAADEQTFTVDFNHPLAGQNLRLELDMVALNPAAALVGQTLDWKENHEEGLETSKAANKPAFLLLYADWCSWCKKLKEETLQDPRILALRDRFVWVRINSDLEADLKRKYQQSGFPTVVLLRPDGTEAGRIDGFKDAAALRRELLKVL